MAERPSELLPCPFCGSDDIRHWDAVYFETFCHDCGAAVRPEHKTPEGEAASIQAWNLCEGLRSRARALDAAPSEPSAEAADELARLRAEVEGLREVAKLAKEATWLQAACWDLADGSGVFISTESMKRFDEVFGGLSIALGQTVELDEEAEAEMFLRPSKLRERAETAERERDELRRRIAEADVAWIVGDDMFRSESEAIEEIRTWGPSDSIAHRVALVRLDAEEGK